MEPSNIQLDDLEVEVEEDFYRPRPPSDDSELDLTPMIDMTFLLLIFFLVSSRLTAEESVELPKARHGNVVLSKESVIVLMQPGTGQQAEVLRADGKKFSDDVEQQNAEVAEYVAQALDAGKKHVIIRAAGAVRHGEVGRISKAISESLEEGSMINIAVIEAN